ncbi:MAG: type II and III secretion system protein [Gemmataceae bacterium]|nr:type II and III secretion system protein [Gemmataceae bacterium]
MNTFALVLGLASAAGLMPAPQVHIAVTVYEGDPLGTREAGTVRVLAEPQVVTPTGRPGFFLVGKDVPCPTPRNPAAVEKVGTSLELLPVVLRPDGRVWVELNAKHRQVNPAHGVETAAGFVPGFTELGMRAAWISKPGESFRQRIAARSATDQTWVEVTVRPVK